MTIRMDGRSHSRGRRALVAAVACLTAIGCHRPATQQPARQIVLPPEMEYSPPPPLPSSRATAKSVEEIIVLGTSLERRPIEAMVFGRRGEMTLIMGGFHGNESTGVELCRSLVRYLREHPEVYPDRRIAIIPEVNPDGVAHGTRANRNGVDINRNFPASNFPTRPSGRFAGGRRPASEAETRAVLTATRRLQPAKIVSIHSIAAGRHGNNYDGPAHALATIMSRHNGYPVLPTMGYETPGSFGTWAGVDQRIPTITLELPRNVSPARCWEVNREAILAAVRFVPPDGGTLRAGADSGSRATAVGK
ncbi:MAG TPA: DUF2817 domain-containing protein [Phycisphaerae bacterium]|nr:DUF2817 domain-containing protein [Phycisphaerae bacterium]HRY66857.1 DUF2817 domain-containing protein [Phycisphaerae bacterium]HSA26915.1 DUF2817 domain-containing protein [Phycisphaerae bacterium]